MAASNGQLRCVSLGIAGSLTFAVIALAGVPDSQTSPKKLADASLEELMSIEVTSVSKKEEKLSDAAAAVFVITQDDIRRSGAATIPEVLRLVPGLDVARIDTNEWAISARGFNGKYANKLLVLVDGRSVYSELYSGVYWDVQDMMLEDIDRIEVIRGPGATMWGANAVNGVINIITKSSKDTQGALLSTGGGDAERGFGALRYGGKMGTNGTYRLYGKAFDRSPLPHADGTTGDGDWSAERGGFRADWTPSARDSFLAEGDIYHSGLDRNFPMLSLTPPYQQDIAGSVIANGGSLLTRWQRNVSAGSHLALQVSYENSNRRDAQLDQQFNVTDIDFQHRFRLSDRNWFEWGLGYRFTDVKIEPISTISFNPPRRRDSLFQGFVQDDFEIVPGRLTLTFGSKFEHNPFAGFEAQPDIRMAWKLESRQTVWAAASRAVRTPSMMDTGLDVAASVFPNFKGTPMVYVVQGNPEFQPEEVLAYESGYRLQPSRRLSLDLALFYNDYNRLRSSEARSPYFATTPVPHEVIPLQFENLLYGRTYGAELSANFQIMPWWRLSPGYSWLKMAMSEDATSTDALTSNTALSIAQGNPQHQFQIRSYLDLPFRLELDAAAYSVSSLSVQGIGAYTRTDARLGWRAMENVELSIAGENLLNGSHLEYSSVFDGDIRPFEVGRSVYGKITWWF